MKYLLLIVASCMLFSCGNPVLKEARKTAREARKKDRANKALQKLVKKYPDLTRTDTTMIHDTIKVAGGSGDTTIFINQDVSGFDSILFSIKADLQAGLDSVKIQQLQQNVHNYITNRQVLAQDTFTWSIDTLGLTMKVYEENGVLKMKYKLDDKYINHTTEVVTQRVMEAQKTFVETMIQKVWSGISFWFWLCFVLVILFVAWWILKQFFPVLKIFS